MNKKNNQHNTDELKKTIEKSVIDFLDYYVTKPAIQTINNDFFIQDKIAEIILLADITCDIIHEEGTEIDTTTYSENISYQEWKRRLKTIKSFISNNDNSDKDDLIIPKDVQEIFKIYIAKKHLTLYFNREIKWICISLLSASYISSYILMRSCFELLVNISTKVKLGMKDKIYSIKYFTTSDKELLLEMWRHLCKWTHPHKQWEKEVCPIYISHNPMYHQILANDCIEMLEKITGFFIVMSFNPTFR